jgi:hypothetical protein
LRCPGKYKVKTGNAIVKSPKIIIQNGLNV